MINRYSSLDDYMSYCTYFVSVTRLSVSVRFYLLSNTKLKYAIFLFISGNNDFPLVMVSTDIGLTFTLGLKFLMISLNPPLLLQNNEQT